MAAVTLVVIGRTEGPAAPLEELGQRSAAVAAPEVVACEREASESAHVLRRPGRTARTS